MSMTREECREYYRQYYKKNRKVINLQRKLNKLDKGKTTLKKYKPRIHYKTDTFYVIKNGLNYLSSEVGKFPSWNLALFKATLFESREIAESWLRELKINFCYIAEVELREKIGIQQVIDI